jgi:hypothetical protein
MKRTVWIAAVVTVGLLLTACQPSRFTYVSNSDKGAYLRFPSDWHLFQPEEVLRYQLSGVTPETLDALSQQIWAVAFDADPIPDLDHVLVRPSAYPFGYMEVRRITDEERDQFSLSSLRNEIFRVDQMLAAGRLDVLDAQDFTTPEGLRGVRLRFNIALDGGGLSAFDQTAYVDPETRTVYVLLITCTVDCFEAHRSQIDQVLESWTIKEPEA